MRIRRGKLRCRNCSYEWAEGRLPLRLNAAQWRRVVEGFCAGLGVRELRRRCGLRRQRLYRALNVLRRVVRRRNGELFGDPAFDNPRLTDYLECSLEGHERRELVLLLVCRATTEHRPCKPFCRSEVVAGERAEPLLRLVRKTLPGLALVEFDDRVSLNELEPELWFRSSLGAAHNPAGCRLPALWRRLREAVFRRGGVRSERLPLYLAEETWRFNGRYHPRERPVEELLSLLSISYYWRRPGR